MSLAEIAQGVENNPTPALKRFLTEVLGLAVAPFGEEEALEWGHHLCRDSRGAGVDSSGRGNCSDRRCAWLDRGYAQHQGFRPARRKGLQSPDRTALECAFPCEERRRPGLLRLLTINHQPKRTLNFFNQLSTSSINHQLSTINHSGLTAALFGKKR